jgi:hypothetical protein
MMESGSHRYVPHDNLFLAVDGDLSILCRALSRRDSPFARRERSARGWLHHMPVAVLLPARLLRVVFAVLIARFTGRNCSLLPYKADVAIRCRPSGYKYFDFGAAWVVVDTGPVFSTEDFEHYLLRLKQVGDAGLGPRVRAMKADRNLYQEELIKGERVRSILDEWCELRSPLAEFLQRIAHVAGCRSMRLAEYREKLARQWQTIKVENCEKSIADDRIGNIVACWNRYFRVAEQFSDYRVLLALSHGDFREKNFSKVNGRIVAVDWLTADERSGHYDLHSILFTALVHLPLIDDDLRDQVYRRLALLRSCSTDDAKTGGIVQDSVRATDHDIDFSVFVLEFLITRLRHFVIPYGTQSVFGARMLTQLGCYIEEFELYRQRKPDSQSGAADRTSNFLCVV